MIHSEIGEDFPVEVDVALFQGMHELRIREALESGSSIDTSDPESAESTFFGSSVAIGKRHGAIERILRYGIDFRSGAKITARCFQDFFASLPGRHMID